MILQLKYKIFLSILVLLAAALGSMVMILEKSFDRSFLQYVNEYERKAQSSLIANLGDLYHLNGNWDFIRDNQDLWNDLIVSNFARATGREIDRGVYTLDAAVVDSLLADGELNMSKGERRFYRSNVALLDATRNHIVGREIGEEGTEYKIITTRYDNEIIGYLAARPLVRILETPDIEFSNQQLSSLKVIAVGIALLTFLLSIPLARYLVTRINTLASGTRELALGNYNFRIPDTGNDELGKLSRDFNLLARTLEENEKARCQWIADISHELRTPLTVLRGEVEAVQDKVRTLTPDTIDHLYTEVLNLDRLVKDLYELSMSDIGALSYHKQRLDISDTLAQCISIYHDEFADKDIALVVDVPDRPVMITADRDRLTQLFSNLLTNSLRYTDAGGRLEVSLREAPRHVLIEFSDSEPAVPDEDIPRLFDRLFRVESSRNRVTGGTGLGLAICKNIVEAHQGSITATRSDINGLNISISLPLSEK